MPVNNHANQQGMGKNSTAKPGASSFRKSNRKAPGTRLGTLEDWREGSNKSGKISGRHGNAIRDGR